MTNPTRYPLTLRLLVKFTLLTCLCAGYNAVQAAGDEELQRLKRAVIKIHASRAAPDYFTPWRLLNLEHSSGSGAVIKGNRILTNAHVVADAQYLQVQRHNDPKKFVATVDFVSHDADLAILAVADDTFFDGLKPLAVGELPPPLTEVSVFGFPFGGVSLSITKGVLSRVEHQRYSHAGSYLLAGQIDAAINPGNSGGPVIVDNKIVGVVMQANARGNAENQGYFVPTSVVKHLLEDAEDQIFHGIPELGIRTQSMESPTLKRANGMSVAEHGVMVTKVFADSSAAGLLKPNDILTGIDGQRIADDETIRLGRDGRTNYKYVVDNLFPGDLVSLDIIRAGQKQTVQVPVDPVSRGRSLVHEVRYDQQPRYLVYGGVVFVPLNMNLIKRWGRDWQNKAPVSFLQARSQWAEPDRQELVVALKVLAADVNLGYHNWSNWIIDGINGEKIVNFQDFAHQIAKFDGEFVTLTDAKGYQMVIDHQRAQSSELAIQQQYGLPASHSEGLFDQVAGLGKSDDNL
jgi:S1-C subfamily serine protease